LPHAGGDLVIALEDVYISCVDNQTGRALVHERRFCGWIFLVFDCGKLQRDEIDEREREREREVRDT